jgi:predicted nucleotidyltransferase
MVPNVLDNIEYRARVKRVGVFGSVARGEATDDSDIDFVIDYEYAECTCPDVAIFEAKVWFSFEETMRNIFTPVELSIVSLDSLNQNGDIGLIEAIERDVIWIYESK